MEKEWKSSTRHKRKVILIGIFVLLVICLYVSISYSYYLIGNDKVEIETAMESPSCVGISIDSGEAFSLNGDYAVPITNAQFLNSKPQTQDIYKYSFTITNSCDGQDLNGLTIGLVPLDGSNLPISNLKYILIKSDENDNSFVENDIKEFTDDSVKKLPKGMMQQLSNSYKESATNVYPVGSTSLSGKNPVSYDLYVWIDSSAGNETMDETFKAAVVLYKEETILDVLLKSDPGDGELIHHTEELLNSAGDDGYRYSGNQPNNYICFGKGSEKYNRGEETECPLQNKYRIIGYVPVTVGGETKNLVKVIKAEYLTEDEFGTKAGTASVSSSYAGIKRIEAEYGTIPAYKWNDTKNNNWKESTLYTSLNSDDSNGYKNKAFGDTWLNKIEKVKWNVGGASLSSLTAQKMYEAEMTGQGVTTQVDAQIGLMYAHDYGFASSPNNWEFTLYGYNNEGNNNRENNWLFNGVYEWTISRTSSGTYYALYVTYAGYVNFCDYVNGTEYAVRPVFYLKSDVNLIKEDTANGSKDHPFKIADSPEPTVNQLETLLNIPVGDEGEFLEHNPDNQDLPNNAGDGGYRYSGNQPNNYICFGKGSEAYNRGDVGATCDIKNKYRIIGYVPVTVGEETKNLVKVIKAEYLTEDEFGTKARTATVSSTYDGIKRIESPQSGIPGYQWNNTLNNNLNNNWKESTLYTSLNSDDSNGYKDKAFGDTWLNKIETVKWNVGGISDPELTAQEMYEEEMTVQGATATVDAQIGLMYAHDYGFASEKNSWSSTLCYYDNTDNENRENNWLFNGVLEWTISRDSSDSKYSYYVDNTGYVYNGYVNGADVAVRPVFYLKSDVKIVGGDGSDGSRTSPLRVK